MKIITLDPLPFPNKELEAIRTIIIEHLRRHLYQPLMKSVGLPAAVDSLKNASPQELDALLGALQAGRITFNRGIFSGRFSASTSRALKSLGGKWSKGKAVFRLPLSEMPLEIQSQVQATQSRFTQKLQRVDDTLRQILPEKLADSMKLSESFDKTIFKMQKEFKDNVGGLKLNPTLTEYQAGRISAEWQDNLRLYIRKFAEEEIEELRERVRKTAFAGDRYGTLVSTIQKSYGVAQNKAEFLARQETKLLVTKYQEARYGEVGIHQYLWNHVTGTAHHPVRPRHFELGEMSKQGKVFDFRDPPVTTEPGEKERRNNPGQDFNCRCFARAVVRVG